MTESRPTVIIPAHNEAGVITRTLWPLSAAAVAGELEVIVVSNGCSDDTAAVARSVPGVQVLELAVAGKAAALNAGDAVATGWPRLYLDGDIEITLASVSEVVRRLSEPEALAGRPAFRYDSARANAVVRGYYRARTRMPVMSEHLWGAGAYALTAAGHRRLGRFPEVRADDVYVDSLFVRSEIVVVDCDPVRVRTPRTLRSLLTTLRRVYQGRDDVAGPTTRSGEDARPRVGGFGPLRATVSGPASAVDATIYLGVVVVGRLLARRRSTTWLRDDSSRSDLEVAGSQ